MFVFIPFYIPATGPWTTLFLGALLFSFLTSSGSPLVLFLVIWALCLAWKIGAFLYWNKKQKH